MNLANLVTLARLFAVPVVVWLILSDNFAATFWVFVAASISDAIDGYIAKRFDQRTDFGALADPIADKTLIVTLFVTLGIAGRLPNWLVIMVVFRDFLIIGGFLLAVALAQPVNWRPLFISKLNTTLQLILIAVALAESAFGFNSDGVILALIYLVAATTIVSGGGYLVRWGRVLAGREANP
ncbi:MAG TPA: CDP-alcohol phosphatidyltransferase family protein [Stellaceae bacterium]|nr:CDP-alcohol phosphatidyltransferase family protein [Stellaceae bacterium]